LYLCCVFFFQAEDGIRDFHVTEFRRVLFRSQKLSTIFELKSSLSSISPPQGTEEKWREATQIEIVKLGYSLASSGTERLISLRRDRKSTRLNSSHVKISYAVFCLKKKKTK